MRVQTWLILAAIAALTLPAFPPAAGAEEPDDAAVLARVRAILAEQDSYAAADYVQGLGAPPAVARAYAQVVMDLHWKASDPAAVVALGRAGILYCLTKAGEIEPKSREDAARWRSRAKAIAYNVGSFTWPGWGREGLSLDAADVAAGREAAGLDLRLAKELGKPAGSLSAAFWLVGAHQLAAGEFDAATTSFRKAQAANVEAGAKDGALMCSGYAAIAGVLSGADGAQEDLQERISSLQALGTDDAKFYAKQLEDALPALRAWLGDR